MSRIAGWIVAGPLPVSPCMAQDTREPAVRTEAERGVILAQMRLFLQSTQAITVALDNNDLRTVGDEAAARGRKGMPGSAIPSGMKPKDTPAWTAMMGDARAGFDDIVRAEHEGASPSS